MKNILHFVYIIIPLMLIISSCSKEAGPIQGEVTFITGNLKINNVEAPVGSHVSRDDVLLTGEKSEAVIQISEAAVITMRSETEVKFGDLMRNRDRSYTVSMELNRGNTFNKVMKKGTGYTVKAPTAVASVRGTSFEMSAEKYGTRINVETGTVYVRVDPVKAGRTSSLTEKQNTGEEEIVLNAGESLVVPLMSGMGHYPGKKGDYKGTHNIITSTDNYPVKNNTGSVYKGDRASKSAVRKNKTVSSMGITGSDTQTGTVKISNNKTAQDKTAQIKKDTAAKKTEGRQTVTVENETKPDPEEVKALVKNKNRNLDDIKEVYSRIDKVYLYSGEVITGAIVERGDRYTVLTTEGIVKVSKKDIQSNEIIK